MSGFIVKYGIFAHQPGEVALQISRTSQYDDKREKVLETETWTLDGLLINPGSGANDMRDATNLLKNAYSVNKKNLILFQGDGVTLTAHALLNAGSFGGTRVTEISFPKSEGPEALNFRTYRIQVTADFEVKGQRELVFFQESLRTSGGLRRRIFQQTLTGEPVPQVVAQKTVFKATQSGKAVGYTAFPAIPAPIFPDSLDDNPSITQDGPKEVAPGVYREFGISWDYKFSGISRFEGEPNVES